MITKVFREHMLELASTTELDAIFSNINDITELTTTLIGSLEDTLEMSEDGQVTAIGSCFEELAEAEEFEELKFGLNPEYRDGGYCINAFEKKIHAALCNNPKI